MARFEFRPARPEDGQEVEEFNRRMAAAGTNQALSVGPPFRKIARHESSPLQLVRYFCFMEGRLRGGVAVKSMPFLLRGRDVEVANISYPVSEGVADRRFAGVGMAMLRELTRRHPLLYALGVGSMEHPLARLLQAFGWHARAVPFHFFVLRAGPFLRNFRWLRRMRGGSPVLDVLATTGLGSLGFGLLHAGQRLRRLGRGFETPDIQVIAAWDRWTDDLWTAARGRYELIGERSSRVLEALYPPGHPYYRRISIGGGGEDPVGWAVVSCADLRGHSHFGDARLGAVIDAFAAPNAAQRVADATLRDLKDAGADVVVVNHSDGRWTRAFRRAGFLSWRSNFFLFLSPELAKRLSPPDARSSRLYFMRGDGDGPVHLW